MPKSEKTTDNPSEKKEKQKFALRELGLRRDKSGKFRSTKRSRKKEPPAEQKPAEIIPLPLVVLNPPAITVGKPHENRTRAKGKEKQKETQELVQKKKEKTLIASPAPTPEQGSQSLNAIRADVERTHTPESSVETPIEQKLTNLAASERFSFKNGAKISVDDNLSDKEAAAVSSVASSNIKNAEKVQQIVNDRAEEKTEEK
jgi:hypothetical protein